MGSDIVGVSTKGMVMARPRVSVLGPAYLDRVLMVDRPLRPDPNAPAIDRSAEVVLFESSDRPDSPLILEAGQGRIRVDRLPDDWPGPRGLLQIESPGLVLNGDWTVEALSGHDDLGGMGAGFSKALGGTLHPILGDRSDPITMEIKQLLNGQGIRFEPTHRPGRASDWTLLVSSGQHGDKLPIGFRGILHDAPEFSRDAEPVDLLIVAGLSNRLARSALGSRPEAVRVFAPSIRNMRDSSPPVSSLIGRFDVLCLNRGEWLAFSDRDAIADRLALLMVSDGPNGALIRSHREDGAIDEVHVPAFPRDRPPVDTNRAGETLASTLLLGLWEGGWRGGPVSRSLVESAGRRASAAAALQLDLPRFGFPDAGAIDQAMRDGRVSQGRSSG